MKKPIKETFRATGNLDKLNDLVLDAGLNLGWRAISVGERHVEFQINELGDRLLLWVDWTSNGNINLTAGFNRSRLDLASTRRAILTRYKLSFQREEANLASLGGSIDSSQTEAWEYTNQIEKQKTSRKLFYVIGILIAAIIAIYAYLQDDKNCGCTNAQLDQIQRNQVVTRAKAREICCGFRNAAEEYNRNKGY